MSQLEIEKKLLDILSAIQPSFDFTQNVDFVKNGYLDSFDMVTLISELEKEFGITISALEIVPENFCSLSSITNLIEHCKKIS